MKRILASFLMGLLVLLSVPVFSQTNPVAPSSGAWILIDSSYQVGTSLANQTTSRLYFDNTTNSKITGLQFKVFYDTIAFPSTPTVAFVPNTNQTLLNQYFQAIPDTSNGSIIISLVFNGNDPAFTYTPGPMFDITFPHAPNSTFQTLTSISPITFTGASTFTNVASLNAGLDTTLNLHSYGGVFERPSINFHGTFTNVTGTKTKNIVVQLQRKPKTSGSWNTFTTATTSTLGTFSFPNQPIDTTYYDARIYVKGDTLGIGNTVTVADAQKVNDFVTGVQTPQGFDFYTSDVNGSNDITISDVYVIFGRIAGRFSQWVNSVPNVRFFTPTEYATITGSPSTNFTGTISGVTDIYHNITTVDSVNFYTMGYGDANGTGFYMAKLTPIKIINPLNAPNYIIDMTTDYYDIAGLNDIEVNMPNLTVSEGNIVNVPVKVFTHGNKLSSLQLAVKYDQDVLEFKNIIIDRKIGDWLSFTNPQNGIIEWGGIDMTEKHRLENDNQAITLQFLAKKPKDEWSASPIYVTRKFAGQDGNSRDMIITPTNGLVEVLRVGNPGSSLNGNIDIAVYPNPTAETLTVKFKVPQDDLNSEVAIYDTYGRKHITIYKGAIPQGEYMYAVNLEDLKPGMYYTVLKSNNQIVSKSTLRIN